MKIARKTFASTAAGLAALTLAASVADAPPPSAAAAPPKPAPACFWTRSIQNFAAPDEDTVYLRVGAKRVFQLKLFSHCLDVDWANHLAVRARGSSDICEGRANDVEIVAAGGPPGQRCPVTDIRLLTPEEVAALPKNARP